MIDGLAHGQIWWASLDTVRPVVVLTRGRVAPLLSRVLVAPVTTQQRGLPNEIELGIDEGVAEGSVASLDNTQLLPVDRLLTAAGAVAPLRWPEFCQAMAKTIGC